jgi:hypothetical protein
MNGFALVLEQEFTVVDKSKKEIRAFTMDAGVGFSTKFIDQRPT